MFWNERGADEQRRLFLAHGKIGQGEFGVEERRDLRRNPDNRVLRS